MTIGQGQKRRIPEGRPPLAVARDPDGTALASRGDGDLQAIGGLAEGLASR